MSARRLRPELLMTMTASCAGFAVRLDVFGRGSAESGRDPLQEGPGKKKPPAPQPTGSRSAIFRLATTTRGRAEMEERQEALFLRLSAPVARQQRLSTTEHEAFSRRCVAGATSARAAVFLVGFWAGRGAREEEGAGTGRVCAAGREGGEGWVGGVRALPEPFPLAEAAPAATDSRRGVACGHGCGGALSFIAHVRRGARSAAARRYPLSPMDWRAGK
ncbi:uncharacterized protein A4U43_C09F15950 [Asparagus officinalis]|uniref:Uncharacterized protein n=1 Tax=Asparagus officinalis TaxID=4686 RepID=A0A5P1E823_ASPOF|nr:uncharacterized protein A4U43_C09F15950 [Asparagus officinalis]